MKFLFNIFPPGMPRISITKEFDNECDALNYAVDPAPDNPYRLLLERKEEHIIVPKKLWVECLIFIEKIQETDE